MDMDFTQLWLMDPQNQWGGMVLTCFNELTDLLKSFKGKSFNEICLTLKQNHLIIKDNLNNNIQ